MSFFDSLGKFAEEIERLISGKPKMAVKLKSCKRCTFYKRGYCTQTSPPTRVLSEYYAQGCINYTTSLPVVGVNMKNIWQDAENLDTTHGYTSYIWIPDETLEIKILKLHVYAEQFRAYSKSAKSATPSHTHGVSGQTAESSGIHAHGWSLDNILKQTAVAEGHQHDYYDQMIGEIETSGGHAHSVSGVTSGSGAGVHGHNIDYGIYEEAITGRTLSAKLYDPDGNLLKDFGVVTTGEDDVILNLSDYFETLKYGMFRLELTASSRLRVRLIYYELGVMSAIT